METMGCEISHPFSMQLDRTSPLLAPFLKREEALLPSCDLAKIPSDWTLLPKGEGPSRISADSAWFLSPLKKKKSRKSHISGIFVKRLKREKKDASSALVIFTFVSQRGGKSWPESITRGGQASPAVPSTDMWPCSSTSPPPPFLFVSFLLCWHSRRQRKVFLSIIYQEGSKARGRKQAVY